MCHWLNLQNFHPLITSNEILQKLHMQVCLQRVHTNFIPQGPTMNIHKNFMTDRNEILEHKPKLKSKRPIWAPSSSSLVRFEDFFSTIIVW